MIDEITNRLWSAQFKGEPCAPPSEHYPKLDVQTAYAVQDRLMSRRRRQGLHGGTTQAVGRKIGLTSRAIQEWLGVSEPDFGVLLDDMIVADGASAPTDVLMQPRIEAEVAFVLSGGLSGPGVTTADVIRATDHILPALEIIDSRIADWNITYEDTIADNASSGLFVLGNHPRRLDDVDLRLAGMKMTKNGRVVSTGAGAACLDHPINAVVWLANKLGEFEHKLHPGDIVLSGAVGPAVDVSSGDAVRAAISGLGTVSVRFD